MMTTMKPLRSLKLAVQVFALAAAFAASKSFVSLAKLDIITP